MNKKMDKQYDVVIVGSGPGGYETAIRASQLGFKTAVVEKNRLGGVCLNVGCIPTKSLLKSAEMMEEVKHLKSYGLKLDGNVTADFEKVIGRSRHAAAKMNKGVQFLMKKNGIDVVYGHARLAENSIIEVTPSHDSDGKKIGESTVLGARHIILATGARPHQVPALPIDGRTIINSSTALTQIKRPERLVICGAGAIGVEFAYFYFHMGTKVTLVEMMDRIVPNEDSDVSAALARSFKKSGIKVLTSSEIESVETENTTLRVHVRSGTESTVLEAEQVLSAIGVTGNIEDLGLDTLGISTDRGAIEVDRYNRTNVEGIYAVGDVAGPPWLAHKASHEGIICIENIAGHTVRPLDKMNIPGCTYCQPQIASVGYTEHEVKDAGFHIKTGKFPFTASGKATASGHVEGFVKVIFDADTDEWLGCHIIGREATEMISEAVTARQLETTAEEIMASVFPHPTLSEAILEATRAAYGRSINM